MRLPVNKIVDVGEYTIHIIYDGNGGLDITVLDELEDEVEGLYISNCTNCDDMPEEEGGLDINPN